MRVAGGTLVPPAFCPPPAASPHPAGADYVSARTQVAIPAGPMQYAPACGRHKKAPLEGSCQAEGLTERCCRSALCGRLARIATAPTPLRHGFAVPPLLKERLWGAVRCRSRAGHAGTRTRDARYLRFGAVPQAPRQYAPACGRHKKAPLAGSCQAEGLTERCCRSALRGRLARIATAPTPLRHGFAVPPLLKERLWGAVRCRSRAGYAGTRTRDARYLRRVRSAGRPGRCAADRPPDAPVEIRREMWYTG